MIRGQLSGGFEQHCLLGAAYSQCTACSPAVVDAFREQGAPFILDALQVLLRVASAVYQHAFPAGMHCKAQQDCGMPPAADHLEAMWCIW